MKKSKLPYGYIDWDGLFPTHEIPIQKSHPQIILTPKPKCINDAVHREFNSRCHTRGRKIITNSKLLATKTCQIKCEKFLYEFRRRAIAIDGMVL